jgi:hypothetical protein
MAASAPSDAARPNRISSLSWCVDTEVIAAEEARVDLPPSTYAAIRSHEDGERDDADAHDYQFASKHTDTKARPGRHHRDEDRRVPHAQNPILN